VTEKQRFLNISLQLSGLGPETVPWFSQVVGVLAFPLCTSQTALLRARAAEENAIDSD